ncbi:MAG: hypothetical protein IJZ95_01295 [Oscillospiraceae bacterium]|nr:hypothetical protein [Oscillospiraceae bacterium]
MSRFTHKLCPVCRKHFSDADDVVVCPECGTPHHRTCYKELGRCGLEKYHADGFVWDGRLPDEVEEQKEPLHDYQESACAANPDPHHATYPQGLGDISHLSEAEERSDIPEVEMLRDIPNPYFDVYKKIRDLTSDDTRGEDGVSSKELCHFVGKSVMHYSQAFSAFRVGVMKDGRIQPVNIFLNFCSGFLSPIHQFYRRMDIVGIAVLLLSCLTLLPDVLLYYNAEYASLQFSESLISMLGILSILGSFINFGLTIALCVFGDYLYYKFCVKRIKKIRKDYDDGKAEGYYEALTQSGSPSKLRAVIGILAYALATQLVARLPAMLLL